MFVLLIYSIINCLRPEIPVERLSRASAVSDIFRLDHFLPLRPLFILLLGFIFIAFKIMLPFHVLSEFSVLQKCSSCHGKLPDRCLVELVQSSASRICYCIFSCKQQSCFRLPFFFIFFPLFCAYVASTLIWRCTDLSRSGQRPLSTRLRHLLPSSNPLTRNSGQRGSTC